MDVSVIIVSYNTASLTKNCINSVLQRTIDVEYEIIVVDNNSTDDSVAVLKENFAHNSNFKLLELNENLGFGKANNRGLDIARGHNVFFLNPDTILLNNAVKILSDYLDSNERVGVCGGNLFNTDMQPAYSFAKYLPGIYYELNMLSFGRLDKMLYSKNKHFNYSNSNISVAYISGADMMTRKYILDEVGTFNPAFFMYYEETELTYRIRCAGYKIMNLPSVKIQHLERQSFGGFKEKRERMFFESRFIYNKLTMGRVKRFIVDRLHYFNIKIAIFISTIRRREEIKEYWEGKLKLYKELISK